MTRDIKTVPRDAPPYPEEIEDRPMLGVCPDCGHNWKTTLRRLRATTNCPRCRSAFHTVNVMAAKAEGLDADMRAQERVNQSPTIFVPGKATGTRLARAWRSVRGRN